MIEILIVDDSAMNRMVLSQILQDEYKISCVASGKEMFDFLDESDPYLILLDVIMPDMDGFEVIGKLKASEEYSKIPVIFITGLNDPASEEKGLQMGAIDYITKPFNANIVMARVKSYVQLYQFIKKAEMMGQNDGLTGLYNKKMTETQIKKQLASPDTLKSGALMIIDVDNFKSINDTFGHLYGDAVITQLGSSLRSIFQKSDILGRVGGDEFFVFLRNYQNTDVLTQRAEELCEEFRKTYEQNGVTVKISASIGIATTEDSTVFEDIYRFADIALYSTKSKGKNGYTFYTGQDEISYTSNRTEIESSKSSHKDPSESIKEFNDNLKEHMFNLVEGEKVVEYTIQSILQMICTQFSFTRAYIAQFNYEESGVKCIYNRITSDTSSTQKIIDLSFLDITQLYSEFEGTNLLISPGGAHQHTFSFDQSDDATICVFALKNKKTLIGYIAYEKVIEENELNPKVVKNIVDVSQQLSTVVINQFLIDNMRTARDNAEEILNSISDEIYVTRPEISRPMFINTAAKNSDIKIHGKECFAPATMCEDCILINAIKNDGFHAEEHLTCKEISWSNGSKAYMIHKRNC